jgi:hypothetical protein
MNHVQDLDQNVQFLKNKNVRKKNIYSLPVNYNFCPG